MKFFYSSCEIISKYPKFRKRTNFIIFHFRLWLVMFSIRSHLINFGGKIIIIQLLFGKQYPLLNIEICLRVKKMLIQSRDSDINNIFKIITTTYKTHTQHTGTPPPRIYTTHIYHFTFTKCQK